MSWWKRLLRGKGNEVVEQLHRVQLDLPGWTDTGLDGYMRTWRDAQGDLLTLALSDGSLGLPPLSDQAALRDFFRHMAEKNGAGLIEARVFTSALGETALLIYKRLFIPAYVFTGILTVPEANPAQMWTLIAGEQNPTGLREAVITKEMLDAGQMTMEVYEREWSGDPYDPDYEGVDRSVMRFLSDDEAYDPRFPDHPLSKLRRTLAALPESCRLLPRSTRSDD